MAMIPLAPRLNVLQKVFAIKINESIGSSFAYPLNGYFCFITAAHVIENLKNKLEAEIEIYTNNIWKKIKVTPYFLDKNDIDIAILKTDIKVEEGESATELSAANLILGQDIYFLGFPYFDLKIKYTASQFNSFFTIPFVKKGVLSKFDNTNIFFDGHNNPGFSGGPIVFWDYQEKKHKVLGIVSSYVTQRGSVQKIETSSKEFYNENSGIGHGYNIRYAKELLEKL